MSLTSNVASFNFGEKLSAPFTRCVPSYIHPNVVTCVNHLLHWSFIICCYLYLPEYKSQYSNKETWIILACALVNFMGMILDCVDGMHARATNQTSRIGAALDHWCDALHVPFVTLAGLLALDVQPAFLILVTLWTCFTYTIELLLQYFNGNFVQTSGVEGQLLTSLLFLLRLLPEYELIRVGVPWIFLFVVVISASDLLTFVQDKRQYLVMLLLFLVYTIPFVMYLSGTFEVLEIVIWVLLLSLHINGSLVLACSLKWMSFCDVLLFSCFLAGLFLTAPGAPTGLKYSWLVYGFAWKYLHLVIGLETLPMSARTNTHHK